MRCKSHSHSENSYSVYLSRPLITPERAVPPLIVTTCIDSISPFFLYNNLNPAMIPCLEYEGGNCQVAVILVDEVADKFKSLGACEGTEIKAE